MNKRHTDTALLRFFQDVIAFVEALHGTVGYLIQNYCLLYANPGSAVHSLITKRGTALRVIFRRLNKAMDLKQNEWHERKDLKPISQMLSESPFHSFRTVLTTGVRRPYATRNRKARKTRLRDYQQSPDPGQLH